MKQALKIQLLASIVRWLLGLAAVPLIEHGIWGTAQANSFLEGLTVTFTGVLFALLSLGWSYLHKRAAVQKIEAALALPSGSTWDDLETTIKAKNALKQVQS